MASGFVTEVLDTLAKGDPSPLKVVWALALAVKEAHNGVQGNKEQCAMLNDQVQHVANSLKALPREALKKSAKALAGVIVSLTETLRSAKDLIADFKKKHWLKKVLSHASITAKFEALFVELDRVLQVCGFALGVSFVFMKQK